MKILKITLRILLITLLFFCLLMLIPRIISLLFPEKPPVGYHFVALDYVAVKAGLEKMVNLTPEIPANVEEIKNIEYKNINGKSLQLDLYRPTNLPGPASLLVFIHGGGWKSGQRSDYLVYLLPFAQKGYVTATVSYRLIDEAPYPACIEDIKDAVWWLFRNGATFGFDPDRIALIGGSAGGHLSLLAAYEWNNPETIDSLEFPVNRKRIKAVVDFYGPVDLTTEYARTHPLVTGFIAKSYEEAPDLYKEASPIHYLDKEDPPTLILQGTSDDLVPASQSVMLKELCDSTGVPAELYCLPLWPHSMDVVQRVNDFSRKTMESFFMKYLN